MIKMIITTLVVNLLIILSMFIGKSVAQMGTIYFVILFISVIFFLVLTLRALATVYFNKNKEKKERLWFAFMAAVTFLNGIITLFAQVVHQKGLPELLSPSIADSYYFSIVTFTTLGYGDFTPPEDLRLFFAGEAIIGYIFFASVMGMIIALIVKDEDQL